MNGEQAIAAFDEFQRQLRAQLVPLYQRGHNPHLVIIVRDSGHLYVMSSADVDELDTIGPPEEAIRNTLSEALEKMMLDTPKRMDRSDDGGIRLAP